MRRHGERIRRDRRYRDRHGVYAVILGPRGVLLTHQTEPVPEWQLPGGGIDPGESRLAALHREVLEETGWTLRPWYRFGAYQRFTYMPEYDLWAEKLCTVYLGRPALRLGAPSEPGHSAHWVPLAAAPALVGNAGDAGFLAALAQK